MILVTVGTHGQSFDRLVSAAGDLAAAGHRVVVQRGVSRCEPPGCEVHDFMPWTELQRAMEEADAVVCHGAPSTIFEAWDAGLRPFVVPRDPARGEHVDDHQIRFCARLGDRVRPVPDVALLVRWMSDPTVLRKDTRGVGVISSPFLSAVVDVMASTAQRRRYRLDLLQRWAPWRTPDP